jgi:hypothetical protein
VNSISLNPEFISLFFMKELSMNTSTSYSGSRIAGGLLLIVTALLSFAPVAILAPAIGWPASLGNPAATQLDAIRAAPGAVQLGYAFYLLYSVLIAPAMIVIAARTFGTLNRPIAQIVVALAAVSALARCIGILRWLTVMPALAKSHAGADAAGKLTIERIFDAVNTYGGGIGELLGVSLFMGASVILVSVAAWQSKAIPRLFSGLGMVSALLLLGMMLPTVGVAIKVPVAAAVTVVTIWMLAFGGWMLFHKESLR